MVVVVVVAGVVGAAGIGEGECYVVGVEGCRFFVGIGVVSVRV